MARFDWFAWHRNYRTDEWIHSLSEAERWAWVAFLSYANETDFVVQKCSPDILAPLLTVTPVTLRNMLASAIKHGKILEDSGDWYVKNGGKYRVGVDKTASVRMAKMREKQKLEKESVTDVTDVTRNNRNSYVTCQDKDTNKTRQDIETPTESPDLPEPKSEPPGWMQTILTQWNEMAKELGYPKASLTPERKKHLAARYKEPDFDFPKIMQAFREFKPRGYGANNPWKPNFDFITRNSSDYIRILEGEFASNGNGKLPTRERAGNLTPAGDKF